MHQQAEPPVAFLDLSCGRAGLNPQRSVCVAGVHAVGRKHAVHRAGLVRLGRLRHLFHYPRRGRANHVRVGVRVGLRSGDSLRGRGHLLWRGHRGAHSRRRHRGGADGCRTRGRHRRTDGACAASGRHRRSDRTHRRAVVLGVATTYATIVKHARYRAHRRGRALGPIPAVAAACEPQRAKERLQRATHTSVGDAAHVSCLAAVDGAQQRSEFLAQRRILVENGRTRIRSGATAARRQLWRRLWRWLRSWLQARCLGVRTSARLLTSAPAPVGPVTTARMLIATTLLAPAAPLVIAVAPVVSVPLALAAFSVRLALTTRTAALTVSLGAPPLIVVPAAVLPVAFAVVFVMSSRMAVPVPVAVSVAPALAVPPVLAVAVTVPLVLAVAVAAAVPIAVVSVMLAVLFFAALSRAYALVHVAAAPAATAAAAAHRVCERPRRRERLGEPA
mmetsp:Transcript_15032/g.62582  ORF Transcript_15032/g.62582 Transcript_15032/m.62582 type:complete len:447 (-) Transcript_15032:8-1348(-)